MRSDSYQPLAVFPSLYVSKLRWHWPPLFDISPTAPLMWDTAISPAVRSLLAPLDLDSRGVERMTAGWGGQHGHDGQPVDDRALPVGVDGPERGGGVIGVDDARQRGDLLGAGDDPAQLGGAGFVARDQLAPARQGQHRPVPGRYG